MDERLTIRSSIGSTEVTFREAIRRDLEPYGEVTFVVTLSGGPVSASQRINECWPGEWTTFFREIALNWRGWNGVKCRGSMMGDLEMSCTNDGRGHIALRVRISGDATDDTWSAVDTIHLEAGQLDAVARSVAAYFGEDIPLVSIPCSG